MVWIIKPNLKAPSFRGSLWILVIEKEVGAEDECSEVRIFLEWGVCDLIRQKEVVKGTSDTYTRGTYGWPCFWNLLWFLASLLFFIWLYWQKLIRHLKYILASISGLRDSQCLSQEESSCFISLVSHASKLQKELKQGKSNEGQ